MSVYCINCGHLISRGSFCSNCGRPAVTAAPAYPRNAMYPPPPQAYRTQSSVRHHTARPVTPARRIFRIAGLACLALVVAAAIWYAGKTTGFWDKLALDRESTAWQRQPDFKAEQKAVTVCLNSLAQKLEQGDIDGALTYVDANETDYFRQLFTDNADSLPALIYGLKNIEVSFLSSSDGGYMAARMAQVTAKLPEASGNSGGNNSFVIKLVKLDDGWVVESL
jgi:hypothetical protein